MSATPIAVQGPTPAGYEAPRRGAAGEVGIRIGVVGATGQVAGDLLGLGERQRHQRRVALGGALGHGVVDQDAPHHDRRHGQEMAAAGPSRARLFLQPEPGLVGQRSGRQRVRRVLAPHVAAGQPAPGAPIVVSFPEPAPPVPPAPPPPPITTRAMLAPPKALPGKAARLSPVAATILL